MRYKQQTFYPDSTMLDETVANYRVMVNSLGRFDGEDVTHKVTLFYRYKIIEYATYADKEMAMRLARYWLDEMIPVQLAKEAHGLAEPLKAERVSQAETTYQP